MGKRGDAERAGHTECSNQLRYMTIQPRATPIETPSLCGWCQVRRGGTQGELYNLIQKDKETTPALIVLWKFL